LMFVR
jgi:hypothetical protein